MSNRLLSDKDQEIKKLTTVVLNWLAVNDPLEKSDLIFVFGGPSLNQVEKAKELLNQGYSDKILVTGNTGTFNNSDWHKPVAEIYADFLIKNGVPSENILIQNISMNTLEDVTFSIPIIKDELPNIQKIILVSSPLHQRRCFSTFKKQFPFKVKILNQSGDKPDFTNINDQDLIQIAIRSVQECDRLIKYSQKGDIENTPIPTNITVAYLKLKKILKL